MSRVVNITEVLGNLATVGTFFVAILAFRFASVQIREAKSIQEEATAKDLFRDYLKLAFEHPQLARPNVYIGEAGGYWRQKGAWNKDEKYRWFVAFMLNACDEIIRVMSQDKIWSKAILEDLKYHEVYLTSHEFHKEDGGWDLYSPELKKVWKRCQKMAESHEVTERFED